MRLPGKNMRPFAGTPLLGLAIRLAQLVGSFGTVAVTSDDPGMLAYARGLGATTVTRPPELATSAASVYDAIRHAYATLDFPYTFICLLQPTSPLRLPGDILGCLSLAFEADAPAVASRAEGSDVPNGAVYVARTSWLLDGGNWDSPGVLPYYMPVERSVDINTLEDFEAAERVVDEWERLLFA